MASIINASATNNGLVQTADASGVLQLQGNGTTGLTIDNAGKLSLANISLAGTPSVGMLEYNGIAPYFTPAGTQRGIVPGMQYYMTNVGVVGSNATGAQNILGVGVTLNSSTVYAFEGSFNFFKSAGTTSHTFSFGWGGTVTNNGIATNILWYDGANGYVTPTRPLNTYTLESMTSTVLTGAITSAFYTVNINFKGVINVNAGGTFIPQYSLSAAPGGAYTASSRNYMSIWPIGPGAAGAPGTINVGTWA